MNAQTFLLLSTLSSLVLVACDREGEPHPPSSVDAVKATPTQTVRVDTPQKSPQPSPTIVPPVEGHSMPQPRQRILGEIVQLVGKPAAGLSAEHWKIIKARYWIPKFDQVVQEGAKQSKARDVLTVPKGKPSLIIQILTGRFTDIGDKTEQDALVAFHTAALVTAASGGASLPVAFADRRGDANITYGDVILFEVFMDAFVEIPEHKKAAQVDLDQWKELATSPNGLHRLLALRTYRRVAATPEQWLVFYRTYLEETDPSIIEEVADLAFQTAKPEAAVLLAEIRTKAGQVMPADFVARLDRSIDFLQKLPSREQ